MISFVNKWTGEVHELPDDTPEKIKDSWLALSETIKACERAKDKLKPKVEELLDGGNTYDFEDYLFRRVSVQRQNYDKSVMREYLDSDMLDVLLIPDKTAVDRYLMENLEELGEVSTALRTTMIPVGLPYTSTRLEKKG